MKLSPATSRVTLSVLLSAATMGMLVGAWGPSVVSPSAAIALVVIVAWGSGVALLLHPGGPEGKRLVSSAGIALVAGYFVISYGLRPAYALLVDGGFNTPQVGALRVPEVVIDVSLALSVAIAAFVIGSRVAPRATIPDAIGRPLSGRRIVLMLSLTGAISFLAAIQVVRLLDSYPGGLQAALTVRQLAFDGQVYLIWGLQLYRLSFLACLASQVATGGLQTRMGLAWLLAWLPTLVFDALTGSRAELVLRNLLPMGVLVALAIPPAKARVAILATLAAISLVFVGYRGVVRDSPVYGMAPVEAVAASVSALPDFLLGGDEAASFDALLLARIAIPKSIEFRGLEGIAAVLAAPIPSAWLDNKPVRAGEWLTATALPDLYSRGGNVAFSGAADLYSIGGQPLMVFGFAALGWLTGVLTGLRPSGTVTSSRSHAVAALIGVLAGGSVLSVLRADFSELSLLAVRLSIVAMVLWTSARRAGSQQL